MDRYTITPEEQTLIADCRSEWGVQMTDVVVPGSNLVVDDHIDVDSWKIVVLGPGQDGSIDCLMIEWGDMVLRNFDLFDFIRDRAGPGGQTMPVIDEPEPELQARQSARSATEGGTTPKQARAEHKEQRHQRRELKDALRDAIKQLPHKEQQVARALLRGKGVIGKDD